jgi:hypothetical protein
MQGYAWHEACFAGRDQEGAMIRRGSLRSLAVTSALLLAMLPTSARAQEAAPPSPENPPPQYPAPQYPAPQYPQPQYPQYSQPQYSQPLYAPPAAPDYVPAPPYAPPLDPVELEHRGKRKKIIGGLLIGVGTALSIAGAVLFIDGAWDSRCSGHEEHIHCAPSPGDGEAQFGVGALLVGQIMTLVGIPVYVVGGRQMAKARRLAARVALQPLVGSGGSGAVARVGLRF